MKNLLIVLFLLSAFLQANKIANKQIEILKMMTEDNISKAYKPLLSIYKKKEIIVPKEIIHKASKSGNAQALRIQGYQKFIKNQKSGLTMICKAAVLGDFIAIKDLYWMPTILLVTTQDINNAFKIAIKELKQSNIVDYRLDQFIFEKNSKNFTYNAYIKYLNKNVTLYNIQEFQNYSRQKTQKDLYKIKHYKPSIPDEKKDDELRLLANEQEDDLNKIKEKIEQQLVLINMHRTVEKQISKKELWKIIKENK